MAGESSAKQRLRALLDDGYEQIAIVERVLQSHRDKRVGNNDLEQLHNVRMRLEDKWADLQDAENLLAGEELEGLYELALTNAEEVLEHIKEDVNKLLASEKDADA